MLSMRNLIIAFWIFIGIMLVWQFYTYNQDLQQEAAAHPQQQHFYFYDTNTGSGKAPSALPVNGPNVQQVSYWIEGNAPTSGMFTSHIVLKNVGNAKAVSIQAYIRPFRGITIGDVDNGGSRARKLSDSDPLSLMGQAVSFPDLAPGESSTQTVSFVAQPNIDPSPNPNPDISFNKEAQPQPGAGN